MDFSLDGGPLPQPAKGVAQARQALENLYAVYLGEGPHQALLFEGHALFVSQKTHRLLSLDLARQEIVAGPFLSQGEHHLVAARDRLLVTNSRANSVTVFRASDLSLLKTILTGKTPLDLVYLAEEERVLVANSGDGTLSILDPFGAFEIKRLEIGGSPQRFLLGSRHVLVLHRDEPLVTILSRSFSSPASAR